MLPWFQDRFPLYLAPMAGVTDSIFRGFCREQGADVVVTEFVSADGILHRNERTRHYLEFAESERPVGVQLFGAEPERMAEAAAAVVDWVRPDFIDLNFGCPVNKVVCKNGGAALLRDCPLLERVARTVVRRLDPFPVTAKMRIGWDANSVNAVATARMLENCGIRALAVHGRTKAQGYSGTACWETIGEVAAAVQIPVIGNGDLANAADVLRRRAQTGVAGVMIGRAALASPWVFDEIRRGLAGLPAPAPPTLAQRWDWMRRHCALASAQRGDETRAMHSMRARLMAYSKGMPGGSRLREQLARVGSLAELDAIATAHLAALETSASPEPAALCA
jgi:tRNA-dihydrouridine synthase B